MYHSLYDKVQLFTFCAPVKVVTKFSNYLNIARILPNISQNSHISIKKDKICCERLPSHFNKILILCENQFRAQISRKFPYLTAK